LQSVFSGRIAAVLAAWAVLAFVGVRAVLTEFNPDYENYSVIINEVQRSQDLLFNLLLAKDLGFLLLIKLGALIREDVAIVFGLTAFATFLAKAVLTAKALRKPFAFAVLYALLLAPGLDLAAIRAGLAISLLGIAFASPTRKGLVSIYALSVFSHVSMLSAAPAVLAATRRWIERNPLTAQACLLCAGLAIYPLASAFERSEAYKGNVSSVFGLVVPISTIIAANITRLMIARRRHSRFSLLCLSAALAVTALGFGLAPGSITLASRFCEIATFLLLLSVCSVSNGYGPRFWVPVAALSVFPILRNTLSGLWISLVM
jgi:hypothetical protein